MSPVYRTANANWMGSVMAVDTVKLRSPEINEGMACFLEQQCILKKGVQLSTGELLYEITMGELQGSWDSRISFKVMREDWVSVGGRRPDLVECNPYVLVEASFHKFFYGQNIYGNPVNFQELARLFVNLLGEIFGINGSGPHGDEWYMLFHDAAKWEVRRVDWAEMFSLSPAAQVEYFRALKNCKFPRRALKEAKYDTAVHFPGKFTTLRISWHSSDVFIVPQDTALPRDFRPLPADPRRCVGRVSANSVFNLCPVEYLLSKKAA